MAHGIFADRREAGERLAEALARFRGPGTLVLGIPRGGVVVAAEVARALEAPLDVVIARKIGAPGQPELAIGAVVGGGEGIRLLDEVALRYFNLPAEYIERETERELAEIDRRLREYRGDRPPPEIGGRTVIVIDDGIATGYTIRAALTGLRRLEPRLLVVAVPVAPSSAPRELAAVADEVVCLETPEPFLAVGMWYENFEQTTDEEVRRLLSDHSAGNVSALKTL
jgi:putative phosphoribosyl transferase